MYSECVFFFVFFVTSFNAVRGAKQTHLMVCFWRVRRPSQHFVDWCSDTERVHKVLWGLIVGEWEEPYKAVCEMVSWQGERQHSLQGRGCQEWEGQQKAVWNDFQTGEGAELRPVGTSFQTLRGATQFFVVVVVVFVFFFFFPFLTDF